MKKGLFEQTGSHDRRTFGRIYIALALVLVLLVGGVIGGTLAWLTAQSEPVNNVFTPSNISVELTETPREYKMVPGHTIDKNPVVTVGKNSEPCYLFVEVEESNNRDSELKPIYIEYRLLMEFSGWTKGRGDYDAETNLDGDNVPTNVYYREVGTSTEDQTFKILGAGTYLDEETNIEYIWKDDQVLVLPTVTKEMMATIENNTTLQPTLTFTAYAVQLLRDNDDKFDPGVAWDIAKNMPPTN